MIYNVSGDFAAGSVKTADAVQNSAVKTEDVKAENTKQPSYDTFERSHTYDADKVNALKEAVAAQQTMLKDKIMSMISEQTGIYNLSVSNKNFQITEEEREWAKKAIAEGGEFSVDAVATNIMNMAKALSDNNSAYISMLKDAVDMGFEAAAAVFGGKMPDITRDTYNEIMKRFDEWQKEASENAEKISESLQND